MQITLTQQFEIKGLIGCENCITNGKSKKVWVTLDQSFDLSSVRLTKRNPVSYEGEQICSRCRKAKFYCYATEGIEQKGRLSLASFQREAICLLDLDPQIDKDALLFLMQQERLTSFSYAIEQYEERYLGVWSTNDAFVLDYLNDIGLLNKIPKEILPFVDLDRYSDMLIESNVIVYQQDGAKIRVFCS